MAPDPEPWTSTQFEEASAYEPITAAPDAQRFLLVRLHDDRPNVSRLGLKKNAWGSETGTVDLDEGVELTKIILGHLQSCFGSAGYQLIPSLEGDVASSIEDSGVVALVDVDIRSFWTESVPGFWTVGAASDVQFEVKLLSPIDREPIYQRTFGGDYELSGGAVTRRMFEQSLNRAYAEALRGLHSALQQEIPDLIRSSSVRP